MEKCWSEFIRTNEEFVSEQTDKYGIELSIAEDEPSIILFIEVDAKSPYFVVEFWDEDKGFKCYFQHGLEYSIGSLKPYELEDVGNDATRIAAFINTTNERFDAWKKEEK